MSVDAVYGYTHSFIFFSSASSWVYERGGSDTVSRIIKAIVIDVSIIEAVVLMPLLMAMSFNVFCIVDNYNFAYRQPNEKYKNISAKMFLASAFLAWAVFYGDDYGPKLTSLFMAGGVVADMLLAFLYSIVLLFFGMTYSVIGISAADVLARMRDRRGGAL